MLLSALNILHGSSSKTITFGTISAESRAIVPKPGTKRIHTVSASDQTWKQEIKTKVIEDFNNLAKAFEENFDTVNAYKDAFTEAMAMIKSLHKQLNDLTFTNSTTTPSVISSV